MILSPPTKKEIEERGKRDYAKWRQEKDKVNALKSESITDIVDIDLGDITPTKLTKEEKKKKGISLQKKKDFAVTLNKIKKINKKYGDYINKNAHASDVSAYAEQRADELSKIEKEIPYGWRNYVKGNYYQDFSVQNRNYETGQASYYQRKPKKTDRFYDDIYDKPKDFPDNLESQYQAYTQADMSKIKSKGYSKNFTTLEEGVKSYLDWLTKKS